VTREERRRLPTVRAAYIPTLLELLLMGAKEGPVAITTVELSRRLGKSQQSASKHLEALERQGFIERFKHGRRIEVRLTKKGVNELISLYLILRGVLEEAPESYVFVGRVFTGLGEGRYYMSLEGYKKQFKEKLGFEPYPGTLNLRLETPSQVLQLRELASMPGIEIKGFSDGVRTYGGVKCFRALIDGVVGAALIIERTHYDYSVLEVIAPVELRRELGLKDGDRVTVRVFYQSKP